MSSHWYEAVIEKFGTAENFVDQLCEKQFGESMLNYKDVVVENNSGKVFMCKLKDGSEVRLQVHDTCDSAKIDMVLFDYDTNSGTYYRENQISEILYEIAFESEDDYSLEELEIDYETLKPFTTSSTNVYKYDSLDELDSIIKALDEPIVDGLGCSWKEDYKKGLTECYGLVFFWSEYDDFSCGNPYTLYCKIIDGGSISG